MGYTHYWRIHKQMDQETFKKFSHDCELLVKKSSIPIVNGFGNENTLPEFSDTLVSFNGVEDHSYETFYVDVNDRKFQFCKTRQAPYDTVVTASLILLNYYFPFIEVSSDGDKKDWQNGIELFKKVFPQHQIAIEWLE